jgi:DNA-binding transcriptional regulator YdaS (Cro superfamily)
MLANRGVTTIDQIYRDNLRLLVKEAGTQDALAAAIGKSPAQISQWINASKDSKTGKPRTLARATAREIERKRGKPEGWMDQPHAETPVAAVSPVEQAADGVLTEEQQALLAEWKDIPPWKRRDILNSIREAAAQSRDEKAYYLADTAGSKKNRVTAELKMQPVATRNTKTVKHGDGNVRQTALPLSVSANPFDPDSAPANEKAWYRQLAVKPRATE